MKPSVAFVTLAGILYTIATPAHAAVGVRGYHREDGTYVQPHYRSAPDGKPYNNWSTKGRGGRQ
jgi:hypothetical protein